MLEMASSDSTSSSPVLMRCGRAGMGEVALAAARVAGAAAAAAAAAAHAH